MQDLLLGDLTIKAELQPGRVVLTWLGTSNSRDPGNALRPYFEMALAEAVKNGAVLEMHFEQLSYFNSSTVSALLRFIERAERKATHLKLFYDGTKRWQSHNFEAFQLLKRQDASIEILRVGDGPATEKILEP
jgi:hypothetical protein